MKHTTRTLSGPPSTRASIAIWTEVWPTHNLLLHRQLVGGGSGGEAQRRSLLLLLFNTTRTLSGPPSTRAAITILLVRRSSVLSCFEHGFETHRQSFNFDTEDNGPAYTQVQIQHRSNSHAHAQEHKVTLSLFLTGMSFISFTYSPRAHQSHCSTVVEDGSARYSFYSLTRTSTGRDAQTRAQTPPLHMLQVQNPTRVRNICNSSDLIVSNDQVSE